MAIVNLALSVITLKANGLNTNQKAHTGRMSKKTQSYYVLSTRDILYFQRHNKLKVKEWKKILYC